MPDKTIKYFLYVLKAGIFILPIVSLIVTSSLFFPFITGKNFFFRIVVEILFFIWVIVAVSDKRYRPSRSPVLLALSATLLILVLATIFGVNSYRSFWSNYERMEGLIGHIHLFAYFLIVSSVMKKASDWKRFFYILLAVSVVVSVYGYLQLAHIFAIHQGTDRLDATLGNATYLAIFIVFHLFFIFLFLINNQNRWFKYFLIFLFFFELAILYYSATRGAFLGLLFGIAVFSAIMIFLAGRKGKYFGIAAIIALIILSGVFFMVKDSKFIKQSPMFSRIAELFITDANTSDYQVSRARFTIWNVAFNGFKEQPVLGWGPENFNVVFNKYYQPKLYRQEPWFDRTHNIFLDWLISSGIIGFLAYLSIFASALYMVWKNAKHVSIGQKNNFNSDLISNNDIKHRRMEAAGFTALFAAYGFHNLFVFDNLISYYLFFTVLAYIHYRFLHNGHLYNGHQVQGNQMSVINEFGIWQYFIITSVFIITVFSLYFVNLKPIMEGKELIRAMVGARSGANVNEVLNSFSKAISYGTFGSAEAREQLSAYASQTTMDNSISEDDKKKSLNLAIEEFKKQIEKAPNDARYYLFLGALYKRTGMLQDAMQALTKAKELSPQKQQIDFEMADIFLAGGELNIAFDILKKAYDSAPGYREAVNNLAIISILSNKPDYADEIIEKHYRTKNVANKQFINAFAKSGRYDRVKDLWEQFIKEEPNNPQNYISLAATNVKLNQRQEAVKHLLKAIEIDPKFKEQGEFYIGEILSGKNP